MSPKKKKNVVSMIEKSSVEMTLEPITRADDQIRNPRAIFQSSSSIITSEILHLPRNVIDILDDIYASRAHQRCMDFSYGTLLSMTFTIIFWVAHWLAYNRCENLKKPQTNPSLCDSVVVFEIFAIISICMSPFLFITMIYLWIRYSCYNQVDPIRNKFLELKLEGDQWQQQLDYYNKKKKIGFCNCICRKQQARELRERGYGYIILSPYGIILDELILLSARSNIIDDGIIYDNEKILKLTFKRTFSRAWKTHISIYLPENYVEQNYGEKLMQLLKIQIKTESILPHLP